MMADMFMLKPSACCAWQTTRHSYLQPWPVKAKQRTHERGLKVDHMLYFIIYIVVRLITSSSNSFPLGSMAESCLNASSPTKQISWPSYIKWRSESAKQTSGKHSAFNLNNTRQYGLTGSARITTSTVAFPGVSRLTSGVRIFCFSFFIRASMSGNCKTNTFL